jgi:glycerate kinase
LFAPQKGASPAQVEELARRLDRLAADLPRDPRGVSGTGAAGGLAGGLWARYGAELVAGAPWICDAVGLDARLRDADLVVTGEGRLDATTREGKVVAEVSRRAAVAGVSCYAIAGSDGSDEALRAELGLASSATARDPAALTAAARELAASRS